MALSADMGRDCEMDAGWRVILRNIVCCYGYSAVNRMEARVLHEVAISNCA